MKRVFFLSQLLVFFLKTNGQLVVNSNMTPQQYVQDVLVGAGVTVSNVTFVGETHQIGVFDASNAAVSLNNGLILGTGNVTLAIGPNDNGGASAGGQGIFGGLNPNQDQDLVTLSGQTGQDAAILEFDFIPNGDSISFQYIFASEEYLEYVGQVNDAFGFFLSGPGITGPFANNAVNLAVIPGTNTPITINNVNPTLNASYYIDNPQGTNAQELQYDGRTVVLTAESVVQCGQTYHVKLSIQDMSDGAWDSGIFLAARSFSSNSLEVSSTVNLGTQDSILYEGCSTAYIGVKRGDVSSAQSIQYTISGTVDQTDYLTNSPTIDFVAGSDSATLSIDGLFDGVTEGDELITIEIYETVCSQVDTHAISFYIGDVAPIQYTISDTSMPCNALGSVPVWVDVVSGSNPYSVSWNTGATTDTIWVSPTATTTYYATISTMSCGTNVLIQDSATVFVASSTVLDLNVPGDTIKYCPLDSMVLYTGVTSPVTSISWSTGEVTDTIIVSPSTTTTYVVTVQNSCGDTQQDSVTVTVTQNNFSLDVPNDTIKICPLDSFVLYSGANAPLSSIGWSTGETVDTIVVSPSVATAYQVTAVNLCGVIATETITISVNPYTPISNNILTPDTSICSGEQVQLTAQVVGGINTTYQWSDGTTGLSVLVDPVIDTEYILTSIDACNSQESDTVNVAVFGNDMSMSLSDYMLSCIGESAVLEPTINNPSGIVEVIWSTGNSPTKVVAPSSTSTQWVQVTDQCTTLYDTAQIIVPSFAPLVAVAVGDTVLPCPVADIQLSTAFSGGSGTASIVWTDGVNIYPNNAVVSVSANTTFTASVVDTCAIDGDTVSFNVILPDASSLAITTKDTAFCPGGAAELFAVASGGTPPYTFVWDNLYTIDTIKVHPNKSSTYQVRVVDGCNTIMTDTVQVTVYPVPDVDFTHVFYSQYNVFFEPTNTDDIVRFFWRYDDGGVDSIITPSHVFAVEGEHEVQLEVTNVYGCENSITKVIVPPTHVYVPNSFTPNKDNINDKLYVKGVGIESILFTIYDRWGTEIIVIDDVNQGWDGTYNGELVPQDVYVYRLEVVGLKMEKSVYVGGVSVLK